MLDISKTARHNSLSASSSSSRKTTKSEELARNISKDDIYAILNSVITINTDKKKYPKREPLVFLA